MTQESSATVAHSPEAEQKPQTSLVDLGRLRAQRITARTPGDVREITKAAELISADMVEHPGNRKSSLIGAILLAAVVVVIATIVAGLLLWAGTSMLGGLTDGG